jgi:hypothetical protein
MKERKKKGLTLKQILRELIIMQYEAIRVLIKGDKE